MTGETEERPSGWTTDTLHSLVQRQLDALEKTVQRQLDDMNKLLDERFQGQTRAVDTAFQAQSTAMSAAFAAADRAVAAALESAEKAVGKAELASERRFEAVNEFRAQLADQAGTFMPRIEAEAQHRSLSERINTDMRSIGDRVTEMDRRFSAAIAANTSRIDQTSGTAAGTHESARRSQAMITIAIAAIGALIGVAAIIASIVIANR